MFAYCSNNPLMYVDFLGFKPCIPETSNYIRDVTDEITSALEKEIESIYLFRAILKLIFNDEYICAGLSLKEFKKLVDHRAPWDIKRPECWAKTIGTPFPGENIYVEYDGFLMTPEHLGNFTYGILGYAYGFPLVVLLGGSYYAAGFPTKGKPLSNEVSDWFFIWFGYNYAESVLRKEDE